MEGKVKVGFTPSVQPTLNKLNWVASSAGGKGRRYFSVEKVELLLRAVRTNKLVRNIYVLFAQTVELAGSRPVKYFADILFGTNYCNIDKKNDGHHIN